MNPLRCTSATSRIVNLPRRRGVRRGWTRRYYRLSARVRRPLLTDNHYLIIGGMLYEIGSDMDQLIGRLPCSCEALRDFLGQAWSKEDVADCLAALQEIKAIEVMSLASFWRSRLRRAGSRWWGHVTAYSRKKLGIYPLVARCCLIKRKLEREKMPPVTSDGQAVKRILVIDYGGVGDMVLSTPMLCSLKGAYPDALLDVVTKAKYASFFAACPLVHRTIAWPGAREVFRLSGPPGAFVKLIYRRYDLAITCVEHFGGSVRWFMGKAIAFLSDAPVRIGVLDGVTSGYPGMARRFLTHIVPEKYEHEAERMLRLLQPLGIGCEEQRPRVWIAEEDRRTLRNILATESLFGGAERFIGVSPFTVPHKQWPLERWGKLINYLVDGIDAVVVMLGTEPNRGDAEFLLRLCARRQRIVNLVGRTTLGTLTAAVGTLALLVAQDSGPAHLAAALQLPEVVLFGPTNPHRYSPWQNQAATIIRSESGRMEDIPLATVCEAIHDVIRKQSPGCR